MEVLKNVFFQMPSYIFLKKYTLMCNQILHTELDFMLVILDCHPAWA